MNARVVLKNSQGCQLDERIVGVAEGAGAEYTFSEKIKWAMQSIIAEACLEPRDRIEVETMD